MVSKMNLYVEYESSRTGGECLSDEPYSDREPEYVDFSITKISDNKELVGHSREEHSVDFPTKKGMLVYVVYVRYTTGDTFGYTEGMWYIVKICKTDKEAIKIKNAIENGKYKGPHGYNPWDGYFEHLEGCHVETFTVV